MKWLLATLLMLSLACAPTCVSRDLEHMKVAQLEAYKDSLYLYLHSGTIPRGEVPDLLREIDRVGIELSER